jgi:hypothetical protein
MPGQLLSQVEAILGDTKRRSETGKLRLTSEGSLVRTQLRPPAKTFRKTLRGGDTGRGLGGAEIPVLR